MGFTIYAHGCHLGHVASIILIKKNIVFKSLLLVRFGFLSGHLLGKSCAFGWPCVLIAFCLYVILVISCFGFESGFGVSLRQFLFIA